MVVPRASTLSGAFSRTVLRRAGAHARTRASRQIGRRTYASGHGEQQSSELPWIIGSVAVTVPAAGWLWSQGPVKGEHGHGHDSHAAHEEEAEAGGEEEEGGEQGGEEEAKEEPKEESSEDEPKEESKDESEDEPKEDDKAEQSKEEAVEKKKSAEDDDVEKPGAGAPGQINWDSSSSKGPGEGQKGERKPSERKGEKDSQGDFSGAKHPYLDDPEKSKKGLGTTETAKIHGTVDPSKPVR